MLNVYIQLTDVLLCVHQKREALCPLRYLQSGQDSTPPLPNFAIYPLCFIMYTNCDITSHLVSSKRGGALSPKNQDLYY